MPHASDTTTTEHDDRSDYGDFTFDEQEIIDELLANIAPRQSVGGDPLELADIEDYERPKGVHLPKTLGKESWIPSGIQNQQPQARYAARVTLEDQTSRDISTAANPPSRRCRQRQESWPSAICVYRASIRSFNPRFTLTHREIPYQTQETAQRDGSRQPSMVRAPIFLQPLKAR